MEFQETEGFSSINREAQTRYVTVSAKVDAGYNIGLVAGEAEQKLKEIELPKGYTLEMSGENETINESMVELLKMLGLAVLLIYLIMVIESGRTRLRPILMTALTTILGLSTMAVGLGMGADMVQPMAIVAVGGLLYGTLLTLVVVPCIYDLLNRKKDMTEEEI